MRNTINYNVYRIINALRIRVEMVKPIYCSFAVTLQPRFVTISLYEQKSTSNIDKSEVEEQL